MNNINERIFELIKRQFTILMQDDADYYSQYQIVLSNEQQFVKSDKRQPNTIYIVVKFLPSSLIFGQYQQNITIDAVSEQNGIEVCKTLLNEYSLRFNLKTREEQVIENGEQKIYTINEVYTTPSIASNFNEVFYGFRSLFTMNGTFIVSDKINIFDLWYEGEKVECFNTAFDINLTPNTQPYFDSKNYTRSIIQYGTFSFNISMYLTNSPLIDKVLAIGMKKINLEPNGVNTTFNFDLKFKNSDFTILNEPFKLVHAQIQKNIGEIPAITLTFTN